MNEPHRFQPVHARHENIEQQQIEIAGLEDRQRLASIAGDDDAVPGPFQQKPDRRLDGDVIVDDQIVATADPPRRMPCAKLVVKPLPAQRKGFFGKLFPMLLKKSNAPRPDMPARW
jgi:hypothetical protein